MGVLVGIGEFVEVAVAVIVGVAVGHIDISEVLTSSCEPSIDILAVLLFAPPATVSELKKLTCPGAIVISVPDCVVPKISHLIPDTAFVLWFHTRQVCIDEGLLEQLDVRRTFPGVAVAVAVYV